MEGRDHGYIYRDAITGFFRMFNDVGVINYRASVLGILARKIQPKLAVKNKVPAGFTYLGQFIDHDITRMKRSENAPEASAANVEDLILERTPSLDLDSVYGESFAQGLGKTIDDYGKFTGPVGKNGLLFDLPRKIYEWPLAKPEHAWTKHQLASLEKEDLQPLIPDERNDENYLVSQMHVLFLNLHNLLVDKWYSRMSLGTAGKAPKSLGQMAYYHTRNELIYLYQLVVVNDFLQTFLDKDVFNYLFRTRIVDQSSMPRVLQYFMAEEARIPVEFTAAAFRFGHALVRESYQVGSKNLTLFWLFQMTGKRGLQTPGPHQWPIEFIQENQVPWEDFFNLTGDPHRAVFGNAITVNLTDSMRGLVNEQANNRDLLLRNLLRGKELGLPCAQDVISHLNNKHASFLEAIGCDALQPIAPEELLAHDIGEYLKVDGLHEKTPLWLYILLEPSFNGSNEAGYTRLGPLGSIIVGETMRMLLDLSTISIYKNNPKMNPRGFSIFADDPRTDEDDFNQYLMNFGMKDLLEFLKKNVTQNHNKEN